MKKWLIIAGWGLFSATVIAILGFAHHEQNTSTSQKPVIAISVTDENAFLTGDELYTRLRRARLIYDHQLVGELNTTKVEAFIRRMHEVEQVDVFKRLGGQWEIIVKVRQPLARVFNNFNESYYIDTKGTTMDRSPNFTARVLIFSGDIPDRSDSLTVADIINNDSLKAIRILDDMYRISNYVCHDPFLRAQITQVYRQRGGDFVLIPQVGNHTIIFGAARTDEEVREKMEKLKVFYREGLPYEGWNKYKSINLKFKNQIVCRKIENETETQ